MKQLTLLLFFTLFLAYAQAQDKKPDITFEEKTIDFGEVVEGKTATVVFTFFNSGSAPLLLKNVQASCGCTASNWPRQPIMPGKSSTIEAKFNSAGYAGKNVNKSVTVTTNVPNAKGNNKVIILNFKGRVVPASN